MTLAGRPPAVDAKLRPLLFGLSLVLAAIVYLIVRAIGFGVALFGAGGTLALGVSVTDTATSRPADRSQLLTWGTSLLGIGLICLAVYVAVR
ncbi:MAG: hypothetical protein QOH48_315 [Actinomycetota bacterium]|jgi:hypothetical protein|nr:hypothetical protein [Actinomycetota bacterium]